MTMLEADSMRVTQPMLNIGLLTNSHELKACWNEQKSPSWMLKLMLTAELPVKRIVYVTAQLIRTTLHSFNHKDSSTIEGIEYVEAWCRGCGNHTPQVIRTQDERLKGMLTKLSLMPKGELTEQHTFGIFDEVVKILEEEQNKIPRAEEIPHEIEDTTFHTVRVLLADMIHEQVDYELVEAAIERKWKRYDVRRPLGQPNKHRPEPIEDMKKRVAEERTQKFNDTLNTKTPEDEPSAAPPP